MPKPIHRKEADATRWLIRRLRIDAQVKQAELARMLGRAHPYVSLIETGQRRIDIIELRDICHALGTTLPAFVELLESEIARPQRPKEGMARTRVDKADAS